MKYVTNAHETGQRITEKLMNLRILCIIIMIAGIIITFIYAWVNQQYDLVGSKNSEAMYLCLICLVACLILDIIFRLLTNKQIGQGYYHTIFTDGYFWLIYILFALYAVLFVDFRACALFYVAVVVIYTIYWGLQIPKWSVCHEQYKKETEEQMKLKKVPKKSEQHLQSVKKSKSSTTLLLAQDNILEGKKNIIRISNAGIKSEIKQLLDKLDAIVTHLLISEADTDEELKNEYSQIVLKYSQYLSTYDHTINSKLETELMVEKLKEVLRRMRSDIFKKGISSDNIEFIKEDMLMRRMKV